MMNNTIVIVGNNPRDVNDIYVGIDGKAKKVKKIYIGINNKAKLIYPTDVIKNPFSILFTDISNIVINSGNWNVSNSRIEC